MSCSKYLPETTVYVRILSQSWPKGVIEGEVNAANYQWQFKWYFQAGKLSIEPSLGRALIFEPLGRFLERWDYQLEPGGDYSFILRSQL